MEIYCFVDGGHLRAMAKKANKALPDPNSLARKVANSKLVQHWQTFQSRGDNSRFMGPTPRYGLSRVVYYDAWPDNGPDDLLLEYWRAIELLPDTEIGFGALRGKPRRQKRVDSLIAVDMLTGATDRLFKIAILITADADFIPVVEAVRRRGAMVVVAAGPQLADELRRAADRVWLIDPAQDFTPLRTEAGRCWIEGVSGLEAREEA